MSRYCTRCGTELTAMDRFCRRCGEAVTGRPVYTELVRVKQKSSHVPLILGAILIASISLLMTGVAVYRQFFAMPGYERPIRLMAEGIEEKNGEKFLEAFSDIYEGIDELTDDDMDSWAEVKDEINNSLIDSCTYEIKNVSDINMDSIDSDIIRVLKVFGGSEWADGIQEAKELDVVFTFRYMNGKTETSDHAWTAIKSNKKWYTLE